LECQAIRKDKKKLLAQMGNNISSKNYFMYLENCILGEDLDKLKYKP
jgi:hypothetical protein